MNLSIAFVDNDGDQRGPSVERKTERTFSVYVVFIEVAGFLPIPTDIFH
jgi:hypothetical protein